VEETAIQEAKRLLERMKKEERKRRQAKAQAKYHKRAFRNVAAKMTTEKATAFFDLCKAEGTTVHAAVMLYAETAIELGTTTPFLTE
jgi:hypothetical protein